MVSGNVRRTAEIAFGDPNSEEYIDLKNYTVNPQRAAYGWTSNNSVFCEAGMNYGAVCERVVLNGEPGFAWLENAKAYGRMGDAVVCVDLPITQSHFFCLELQRPTCYWRKSVLGTNVGIV